METRKWSIGFDNNNFIYTPRYTETLHPNIPTFKDEGEAKAYCDALNKQSDAAWEKIKHKI